MNTTKPSSPITQTTTAMNCNALYPVVHDLTDAESSYGCCIMTTPPGCFSLQDLVNPDFSPIPVEEFVIHETPKRGNIFRGRQRSEHPAYKAHSPSRSLVDDRNDSSENDQQKVLFSETYVLTRQVSLKSFVENFCPFVGHITHVRTVGQQGEIIKCVGMCSQNNRCSLCCQDYG